MGYYKKQRVCPAQQRQDPAHVLNVPLRNISQSLQEAIMPNDEKVKGPASYFPSIEKTYGKPIAHWMSVLQGAGQLKHMEYVVLLKSSHKLGHGHANALVAYFLAKKQ
jgi:Domain of unknown function (DUF4287)